MEQADIDATSGTAEVRNSWIRPVVFAFAVGVATGGGSCRLFTAPFTVSELVSEGQDQLASSLRPGPRDTPEPSKQDWQFIWGSMGSPPHLYAKAAFWLMKNLVENGDRMTLGNSIALLGMPTKMDLNAYQHSEQIRLYANFKGGDVLIGFSMSGLADCVLHATGSESRSGWSLVDDMTGTANPSDWPYQSGLFRQQQPPRELLNQANGFAKSLETNADWYRLCSTLFSEQNVPDVPKYVTGDCESTVAIIDGLRNDLAVITFALTSHEPRWCDTWWYRTDSSWHRLTPHEGASRLALGQEER